MVKPDMLISSLRPFFLLTEAGIIVDIRLPTQVLQEADQYWQAHPTYFEEDAAFKLRALCSVIPPEFLSPDTSVIDIGCGAGAVLRRMGEVYGIRQRVGCDLSLRALMRASQADPGGVYVLCDARSLPFEDSSFDLGLLCDVLEHTRDPETMLREALRVARIVAIKVPCENNLYNWYKVVTHMLPRDYYKRKYGHVLGFSYWSFKRLIMAEGEVILLRVVPLKNHSSRSLNGWRWLPYAAIFGGFVVASASKAPGSSRF